MTGQHKALYHSIITSTTAYRSRMQDEGNQMTSKNETAKHTPGPWSLEHDGSLVMAGQVVGRAPAPDTATPAEARANAALIAAAPDLLEACEAVYQSIDEDGIPLQGANPSALAAMCADAIAKARSQVASVSPADVRVPPVAEAVMPAAGDIPNPVKP